jgi:hypothetical protein
MFLIKDACEYCGLFPDSETPYQKYKQALYIFSMITENQEKLQEFTGKLNFQLK